MRVLIVEDDDIALDILRNSLTQFGYEVTAAPTVAMPWNSSARASTAS